MLDTVKGMKVFVRVDAAGSLAAAGRALGLSQGMVTKHIDALEARLGVRLLHRSTRGLTLTEAGRNYLDACQRILTEIEEADAAAAAAQSEPRGVLRLNTSVPFGTQQLVPLLAEFTNKHPMVSIDLGLNDRQVDLIDEGWDLVVRITSIRDSTMIARRLTPCRTVVCAAPAYLDSHGWPCSLADLSGHNCLGYTLSERWGTDFWTFGRDGSVKASVSGNLRTNNGDALRAAVLAGMGLAYLPTFLVAQDLYAGRLRALALDHPTTEVGHISVVFRPDRRLPLKSRAMIDFLAERFADEPPWDRLAGLVPSWMSERTYRDDEISHSG